MTNEILTELLQSVGVLGVFLLIGTFLRAKIKIFQDTFLPASVIGGFLLLILGPNCLGVLPIPQEWINIYSLIPGILIVPVVTATPLGMTLKKSGSGEKGGNSAANAAILGFVLLGVGLLQFAIGFGTHAAFSAGGTELYDTFGWEMGLGYSGGHGTAALLGNMLQQAGLPYWETAQGVGVTAATFGLVGGILIGICMINWAARTGRTVYLSEPAAIPQALKTGYERDPQRQGSIGKETTYSSSIDTLAFHAALIFAVCTLAYFALGLVQKYEIPLLSSLSVWVFGLIFMFIVWGIICKLKLDFLVDSGAKGKVTGPFTEFAVIGAIASLPLDAVMEYMVPILVMCLLGYVGTVLYVTFLCKRFLKGAWFESMMVIFGSATGVFLTGILLLRICDPQFKTSALGDGSMAYAVGGVVYFAVLNPTLSLLLNQPIWMTTLILLAAALVCILAVGIISKASYGASFRGNR